MFVALVLLAWHAIRIPIEGDVATSLAHADDVLGLERALSLDVEHAVIGRLDDANATSALAWLYTNIHLPVLFAFVAAARLLAPARYPVVRTTFALAFLPAALVIWLYPLAPPHWLPEFGFGVPPTDAELTNTTGALFHNTTAAAASQHFGFAVLVAATAIWLFPRSRLAYATLVYPVVVFLVIVGTGNHYVVDCIVGTLTLVLAAAVATVRASSDELSRTRAADKRRREHRPRLRTDHVGLRLARPDGAPQLGQRVLRPGARRRRGSGDRSATRGEGAAHRITLRAASRVDATRRAMRRGSACTSCRSRTSTGRCGRCPCARSRPAAARTTRTPTVREAPRAR